MTAPQITPPHGAVKDRLSNAMNYCYVFYTAGMDPEDVAQTYADEASVHANKIGKQLTAEIVDVTSDSPAKQYFGGKTIECTTVKNGEKVGSVLNPTSLSDIDAIIDAL